MTYLIGVDATNEMAFNRPKESMASLLNNKKILPI